MTLSWETRKRLLRLGGIVGELLDSARSTPALRSDRAFGQQLSSLMEEVRVALGQDDPGLADEFRRVVVASDELPADLRAAALAGWLKAELAVESLEDQRASAQPRAPRKKQTLGFKIRSPITREAAAEPQAPNRRSD
jgi:hypothetical protein